MDLEQKEEAVECKESALIQVLPAKKHKQPVHEEPKSNFVPVSFS